MLPNTERIRKIRISWRSRFVVLQLEMFGKIVGNAAGRRRGPKTRRLGSTMAQQLRIGNQWIRKQCLDLTRKISQSVREVVPYLLSINRLSYLSFRRRRRCFTYHGKELIYLKALHCNRTFFESQIDTYPREFFFLSFWRFRNQKLRSKE